LIISIVGDIRFIAPTIAIIYIFKAPFSVISGGYDLVESPFASGYDLVDLVDSVLSTFPFGYDLVDLVAAPLDSFG